MTAERVVCAHCGREVTSNPIGHLRTHLPPSDQQDRTEGEG